MHTRIRKFIIRNRSLLYAEVVDYGARLHKFGKHAEHNILLSPKMVRDYLCDINWLGATVGPSANIVRDGEFTCINTKLTFDKNHHGHHLHGGKNGFHKMYWRAEKHTNNNLLLGLTIKGFGRFTVFYQLIDNILRITYKGKVNKPSLINMTNHAYFNLNQDDRVYMHNVKINSDEVVATDDNNLPLNASHPVDNSPLDLRDSRQLGDVMNSSTILKNHDYNHCYLLNKSTTTHAEITHPAQQWGLRIKTTKPAIHFFTANNDRPIVKGKPWAHSACCLEPVYPTFDYLKEDSALSLFYPDVEYCEVDSYELIATK